MLQKLKEWAPLISLAIILVSSQFGAYLATSNDIHRVEIGVGKLDVRMEAFEDRMESFENRLLNVENRLANVEKEVTAIDVLADSINDRVTNIEHHLYDRDMRETNDINPQVLTK